MNDDARRHLDTYKAMDKFGDENAADFPAATPGGDTFADLKTLVGQAQASGAEQMGAIGEASQQAEIKAARREEMSDISRIARSMAYAFPGIDNQFRMPRNRNDADLLAGARAFFTESAANEADFIAYGLPATFRADLTTAADDFEASIGALDAAEADRAAATAEIENWIVQGMRVRRILDGIVKIKYANDVGQLAAWLQASHIERPPSPTP